MEITFLSSQNYSDVTANNGDCILIDTGSELVIFDCGCKEHAERVIKYMKTQKYSKAKLVLSHNDSDHFNGIPYLIDEGMISDIYTLLLLKYKDELLEKIMIKELQEIPLQEESKNYLTI